MNLEQFNKLTEKEKLQTFNTYLLDQKGDFENQKEFFQGINDLKKGFQMLLEGLK